MRALVESGMKHGELGAGMGWPEETTKGEDAPEYRFAQLSRRVKEHRIAQWAVGFVAVPPWFPDYVSLRKTERFKALIRKIGLVEYWKARVGRICAIRSALKISPAIEAAQF